MTRLERNIRDIETGGKYVAAVKDAIKHCKDNGLVKPLDVAIAIRVALNDHGLKIVRKKGGA